ncbi:exopolysaccharide transport family protein [Enterobacter ludwigii]
MAISLVGNGVNKEGFIDFGPYINKIKRKLIWCFVVLLVTATAAFIFTRFMPSRYTATSTVLFKAQPADITPLPRLENYDSTRSDYYETKYALMGSRVVLQAAAKAMKLDEDPEFNGGSEGDATARLDNAVRTLQGNLSISGVRSTQLVSVTLEAGSPQKAADVANGIAQAFIDYSLHQKQKTLLQAQQWNKKMMTELQEKMVKQKADIDAYLKQAGLLTFRGVDGYETEQLGIVTNHLADATQRRMQAEAIWDKVRQQQGKTAEQVISLPDISGHPQIQDLRIAMTQAKRSLSDAAKHYGPNHPKYRQAQAQLQAINGQIGQVVSELRNGIQQQYQIALDDEQRYQKMLDEQKGNFQQLAAKRDHYNTLQTALDKTEELYKSLYQRVNEQMLSESFSVADEQIYDPATPPLAASKPKRSMLIVMMSILSVGMYIMYLIISTALDKTIHSISELRGKAGLVANGEFPLLPPGKVSQHAFNDLLYADMLHSLRMTLEHRDNKPLTVVVTAVNPGDGSSLMADLLARSASKAHKTLLVGLNCLEPLQDPSHKLGFAQCLYGESQVEQAVVSLGENIDFLPRGVLRDSSLLMLTSDRLPPLLETLHQHWHTVIIDMPSLEVAQDVLLLQPHSDVTLLVVKAGEQSGAVTETYTRLTGSQKHPVAVVLNQVQEENLETQEGRRLPERGTNELIMPKQKS